jgi:DNA-directed RNA polymerase omega subunit
MPLDRSKVPNAFEFVVIAGARAKQLLKGATPRVETGQHKQVTIAQREVAEGQVDKVDPRDDQNS